MQKFRECEKETKTKAFSKEGLKLPNKQNPEDVKRFRKDWWIGKARRSGFQYQQVFEWIA